MQHERRQHTDMDIRFLNRAAAACVLAGAAFVLSGFAADVLAPVTVPARPAFPLPAPVAAPSAKAAAKTAAPGPSGFAALVAHADPARGEKMAESQCTMCHSFERGGSTMIGPALWGVAGTHVGDLKGYDFSPALSAHKDETWTDDTLSAWLKSPAGFAPGTRMGFGGIDSDADRADVVAYLDSLSDKNAPAAPAPAPAAIAGDAAAGKATAQQMCAMCHSFEKDGPAMMGPDLFAVVGRAPGHLDGYSYSPGVAALGGTWDATRLDHWLADPRGMVAGTKMAFPGVPDATDRANIIAFLATLRDGTHP